MGLIDVLSQGDAVTRLVAALLLAMSVATWVVIAWKSRLLTRARFDVARCTAGFWQSADMAKAQETVATFDREQLVGPLLAAAQTRPEGNLAAQGQRGQQLTRLLRNALHTGLAKLQYGQVLLATVGATAPFVGLLGTVWGIYQALVGLGSGGQITIDRVAGPVGEALIMTAAGLAVAIPAVLAYNVFGKIISAIESELEGFARDLRELMAH